MMGASARTSYFPECIRFFIFHIFSFSFFFFYPQLVLMDDYARRTEVAHHDEAVCARRRQVTRTNFTQVPIPTNIYIYI